MKKLMFALLIGIFLISFANAEVFTFDNVKSYDEELKQVSITSVLSLKKLADVKLNTELIEIVPMGEDIKVAEFTLYNYGDYSNLFNDMDFYDRNKDDEEVYRTFEYKYKSIDYKIVELENCSKIGETKCPTYMYNHSYEVWRTLDTREELKEGTYTIGIFTDVKYGDHVEWIPTFYGKRIPEWAEFVQSSGTETIDGDYTVFTFTSNGYFNTTQAMAGFQVLAVAGGGGGAGGSNAAGGGGGAGGVIWNKTNATLPSGNYLVNVGIGGDRGCVDNSYKGQNGTDSTFGNDFFKVTAIGGGGAGGGNVAHGSPGGSGGGTGNWGKKGGFSLQDSVNGTGYGFRGGNGSSAGYGAGGGGATEAGENVSALTVGGKGGDGLLTSINGTSFRVGAGGGGANYYGTGVNGAGAGGDGNGGDGDDGGNATSIGGGGGGGSQGGVACGGSGANGIVIVRYLTPAGDQNQVNWTTIPSNATITYGDAWAGVDFVAVDKYNNVSYSVNDTDKFTINSTGWLDTTYELGIGIYDVMVNASDNGTTYNLSSYRLTINQNTENCQVLFSQSSPLSNSTPFNVYTDCSSGFQLYRNGTVVGNNSVQSPLNEGYYNYTVTRNDTVNYSNIFDDEWFNVTGPLEINQILITLNSIANDSAWRNGTIPFIATTTTTGVQDPQNATLNIWFENGTLMSTNTSLISGTTNVTTWIQEVPYMLDDTFTWNVESYSNESSNWSINNFTYDIESWVNITLYQPDNHFNWTDENYWFTMLLSNNPGDLFWILNSTSYIWFPNGTTFRTYQAPFSGVLGTLYNTSGSVPVEGTYIFNAKAYTTNYIGSPNSRFDWAKTNYTFIVNTEPQIDILAPIGKLGISKVGDSEFLNWTVTDNQLDSCWYDYNGTNISVVCLDNTTTFTLESNNMNLTFYANDTLGKLASLYNNWTYLLLENFQQFANTTTETSIENFNISLNYVPGDWNAISGVLNYDGTNYTSSQIGSGNNPIFTSNVNIPSISGASENKTFFWYVTLTNATGTFTFESSQNNQTVNNISISVVCGAGDTPYLRFFTREAENPFPLLNATFKSSWTIKEVGGSSLVSNFSYEDLTELNNTWEFCISPNSTNYTISVDVEVDAIDFSKSFYYITDTTYSATETTNISLYLLNDSLSTATTLEVTDKYTNPIPEVLIFVQLYDVGTDLFYTVTMAKTNNNGEDTVYLNWYDSLYKFVLVEEGTTILSTNTSKVFESPKRFEKPATTTYTFDKFLDFEYNLYYNDATSNFVLTYVKPSGEVDEGCLRVLKRTSINDTQVCLTCSSSASSTLYCNIGAEGNGTFIATFYATGSWFVVDLLTETIGGSFAQGVNDLLNKDDAAFYAFVMSAIVFLMFLITPVLGIIGIILGLLASFALGFTIIGYGIFLGITIVGGIIIWLINR